ncbi:hypothetical protein, partial [Burkholderia gladioli]|uniref:hypothetical protein n=1 Tax=Burkholderia gladioli TaxID=28095 RepID=UPI001ABAA228
LFQNPDDLAFRESGRLHAKFPVDPAARKFYLEHPLILGGTTLRATAERTARGFPGFKPENPQGPEVVGVAFEQLPNVLV